jgi:AcrR family transcriptional regulator
VSTSLSRGRAGSASVGSPQATRGQIFTSAERLFAQLGFHGVSIRDITEEAGVNVAAVSYHFGSKDDLLLEIFRTRARELNVERLALLREAASRHSGNPPIKDTLRALFAPPVTWLAARGARRTAIEFMLRVRTEGTPAMISLLRGDVSHLEPFVAALRMSLPSLSQAQLYWRFHFCLGLVHNNRPSEFERLQRLSRGVTRETAAETIIHEMIEFASRGFGASDA